MKRTSIALIATTLALWLAGGVASGGGRSERLQLRSTSVGKIIVNGRSFTVYAFTRDGHNHDSCVSISGCAHIWPPLESAGRAIAGAGLKSSLVGSTTLRGAAKQVTYAGHPLYTYSGDSRPGETSYVNFSAFGGHWPALNAAGQEVR